MEIVIIAASEAYSSFIVVYPTSAFTVCPFSDTNHIGGKRRCTSVYKSLTKLSARSGWGIGIRVQTSFMVLWMGCWECAVTPSESLLLLKKLCDYLRIRLSQQFRLLSLTGELHHNLKRRKYLGFGRHIFLYLHALTTWAICIINEKCESVLKNLEKVWMIPANAANLSRKSITNDWGFENWYPFHVLDG